MLDNALTTTADVRAKRGLWAAVGVILILVGSSLSIAAANEVVHSAKVEVQQEFTNSAQQVAATLNLALQHENDLVASVQAFVLTNPTATEPEFLKYAATIDTSSRYPEVIGIGEIRYIPSSGLNAFVASVEAASPAHATFTIIPAGNRSHYCFETLTFPIQGSATALPPGYDFCATSEGALINAAASSGQLQLTPYTSNKVTTLTEGVPIYAGGNVPTTLAARSASFIGVVGIDIMPNMLLDTALQGHAQTSVVLSFTGYGTSAAFRSGLPQKDALKDTINIAEGWRVTVLGAAPNGSVLGSTNALLILSIGIALSLLLGCFLYILGTRRAHAEALVVERTGELQFQTLHDSLTGLPNRILIHDRITQMHARARRLHEPAAAMFLDLDDFKEVNDTLGHPVGDQLLKAVGKRLEAAVRESDTVGRLGGDEFIILVEGPSLGAGAEYVAERILEVLKEPFDIVEGIPPIKVSASIGIAMGKWLSPEMLLRNADIALYQAKAAGKHCAMLFAPAMQSEAQQHRDLAVDLRGALDGNQFFLMYQPTIDLQTNIFTGVEALIRWKHPKRGIVQPNDFIPELEASGLIVPVGGWVLEEACKQAAKWHDQGHFITLSVNVSAKQLDQDQIIDDVKNALLLSGFDPYKLVLELTETTLMRDVEMAIARLTSLKGLGVRIAVDDFGTGYSSMAYLRRFPIDILKIDRSFVSGLSVSTEASALVHTLVQLGKTLNLETVAEGIEDDLQLKHMLKEKVDIGQGFLFSRPLDVAGVDRILKHLVAYIENSSTTKVKT